jgi:gliding motility-associated-like protein
MLVMRIEYSDFSINPAKQKPNLFRLICNIKLIFRFVFIWFFLFSSLISFSQKEGLNWFFGINAGLKFHQGYPEAITGALVTTEGCSTISDKYGNLRFYTDGVTVYTRMHQVMPNGTGLYGDPSSTQSGVIVPVPGDTNIYYIFTVSNLNKKSEGTGFRYSKVDMRLNFGNGDVTDKNILIFESTTERITSVKHSNDYGIWVIGHEWKSCKFRSYLVTPDGINIEDPVISNVGHYHGDSEQMAKGYMKVSPDGKKLAVAIQGENLIQVFDFNDTSGEITNPLDLWMDDQPYGVEFSREAHFLYASERYGTWIYQWDLEAGSVQQIIDSRIIIGEFTEPYSLGGAMQMASDGKIYIAVKQKTYLSAINHPSLPGLESMFDEKAVFLGSGHFCQWGLPTFIQSYFNNLWIEQENKCQGDTLFFSLNDTENIETIKWDFGDPESGTCNQSTEFEAYHIYNEAGYYQVMAVLFYLEISDTLIKYVDVLARPGVNLGEDRAICEGDSVVLSADGNYLYCQWMDDPGLSDTLYAVTNQGNYWIEVHDVCGTDRDTVSVDVHPLPAVDLGNDTIIKYNASVQLCPGQGYWGYTWQDGSTSQQYLTHSPGTFWVEVTNEFGCKSSDTVMIFPESFNIYLPTAFSPNNDNVNDIFIPKSTYEVDFDYEIMIFNRYGQMVFKSNSFSEGWDGNYQNQPCPMEVYTWFVIVHPMVENSFYTGQNLMKGNVTLLR